MNHDETLNHISQNNFTSTIIQPIIRAQLDLKSSITSFEVKHLDQTAQ